MNKAEALKILGFSVDDDPDEKEIKKAFKKKAVKLHPDVNKAENAADQFKELNAAQDHLLNPPPPQPQFHGFQGNPFWGPRVRFSVPPIQKSITISFRDSVLGSRQTLKVNKTSRCSDCVCKECNGQGMVSKSAVRGNMIFTQQSTCPKCRGAGTADDDCSVCSNTRIVQETSEFAVRIPGGITNGHQLPLRGFGNIESHNGMLHRGDIILTIHVEHDKEMRIRGIDVISTIDIPLLDALKGTKKKVRTVFGDKKIAIKKNTKHKDYVVLENHGVERQGHHIFIMNVLYPKDTDKLIEALED